MRSPPDELSGLSAHRLRALIGRSEISPVEVARYFLSRIEQVDTEMQTFVTVDSAGALREARRAERAQRNGEQLGALHGIPISVKEHIPVAGMPTTGFGGRGGEVAGYDWIPIERLRQAGAIVLGTNTMYPTDHPDRWARNPRDASRVCGGSSSGCAGAVVHAQVFAAFAACVTVDLEAADGVAAGLAVRFHRVSTRMGGTWRIGGIADYWSKLELGWQQRRSELRFGAPGGLPRRGPLRVAGRRRHVWSATTRFRAIRQPSAVRTSSSS